MKKSNNQSIKIGECNMRHGKICLNHSQSQKLSLKGWAPKEERERQLLNCFVRLFMAQKLLKKKCRAQFISRRRIGALSCTFRIMRRTVSLFFHTCKLKGYSLPNELTDNTDILRNRGNCLSWNFSYRNEKRQNHESKLYSPGQFTNFYGWETFYLLTRNSTSQADNHCVVVILCL